MNIIHEAADKVNYFDTQDVADKETIEIIVEGAAIQKR